MKLLKKVFAGILCCVLLSMAFGSSSASAAADDNMSHPAVDVLFVLDNSGSMIKNDPDFITRTVVINFLEGLNEQVRIGMVIFDTDARLIESLSSIMSAESAERFLESLEMISYKGQFTNTPAGVERAVYELKTNGRDTAQKLIILLTDGIVDTGNRAEDLESEKWLKETLTLECRKLGIRIFGIAFTEGADFQLMQTLAVNTEGEYFRAFSTDDIETVFRKINTIISKPTTADTIPQASAPETKPAPAVPETPPPSTAPSAKTSASDILPYVLAVIILAGLIWVYFAFVGKKKTILIKQEPQEVESGKKALRNGPKDPAELIDTENIISNESITLPLDRQTVSIGRDPSNDIVIPKDSISSLHATIEYKNGFYYLEDHRSTNGTRLNDQAIRENNPARLKSGDQIHFAIYEFRFLMHDQAPYGETVMLQTDSDLKIEPE